MTTRRPSPRKVGFLEPMNLGDLLCTVPLMRAVRRAWPEAETVLVGDDAVAPFYQRFPGYLDRLLILEQDVSSLVPSDHTAELRALRDERFDVLLKLYSWLGRKPESSYWDEQPGQRVDARSYWVAHERSIEFACAVGAPLTAGFADPDARLPERFLGVPLRTDMHVVDSILRLAPVLGIPTAGRTLEFPLADRDAATASDLLLRLGVPAGATLVGIHPGASVTFRRWPAERFAAVADHLMASSGVAVVITGAADERDLAEATRSRTAWPERVFNAAGATPDLGCLGALLARMRLFVTNNTGPMHVAVAVGTPTVVPFGLTYERTLWGELDPVRQVGLVAPERWQARGQAAAISRVSVGEVIDAATRLLAGAVESPAPAGPVPATSADSGA